MYSNKTKKRKGSFAFCKLEHCLHRKSSTYLIFVAIAALLRKAFSYAKFCCNLMQVAMGRNPFICNIPNYIYLHIHDAFIKKISLFFMIKKILRKLLMKSLTND